MGQELYPRLLEASPFRRLHHTECHQRCCDYLLKMRASREFRTQLTLALVLFQVKKAAGAQSNQEKLLPHQSSFNDPRNRRRNDDNFFVCNIYGRNQLMHKRNQLFAVSGLNCQ